MACQSIANVVKSSLGPVGLDKMLVDAIGDTTVTNDGATILNLLEVDHPAGKVLVELAQLQVGSAALHGLHARAVWTFHSSHCALLQLFAGACAILLRVSVSVCGKSSKVRGRG
jgi:hypothetical protein